MPVAHAESAVTSVLCDVDCAEQLNGGDVQTTASGLQYTDIKVGRGPPPPVGYQVFMVFLWPTGIFWIPIRKIDIEVATSIQQL